MVKQLILVTKDLVVLKLPTSTDDDFLATVLNWLLCGLLRAADLSHQVLIWFSSSGSRSSQDFTVTSAATFSQRTRKDTRALELEMARC